MADPLPTDRELTRAEDVARAAANAAPVPPVAATLSAVSALVGQLHAQASALEAQARAIQATIAGLGFALQGAIAAGVERGVTIAVRDLHTAHAAATPAPARSADRARRDAQPTFEDDDAPPAPHAPYDPPAASPA